MDDLQHFRVFEDQRAQAVGVEMPIAATVVELLDGHITPQAAVQRLMARDPKHEGL